MCRLSDRWRFALLSGVFLACFLTTAGAAWCQSAEPEQLTIPAGTPIEAKLKRHVPMKVGQPVETSLAHAVYAENRLALPAGVLLQGSVVSLEPNRELRNDARLNADFTPYHRPTVTFTSARLPDGTNVFLSTTPSSDGAPVIHLAPAATGKHHSLVTVAKDEVKVLISSTKEALFSPGLGDRMEQLLYHQLPYHPERIEQGTLWTCELREPVVVPAAAATASPAGHAPGQADPASGSPEKKNLELHAYLDEELSSLNNKVGQTFQATVAEPVFGADHSLIVPQGAVLIGTITRVKPAKSFHRDGKLRFNFRQLQMPGGSQQQIVGSVTGVEAKAGAKLKMDSEGGVESQPQGKVIVPLILTVLANHALDDDSSLEGSAAAGSNGMGLIGRVVGIAGSSRDLAAGIGFYGTGVSVYRRWLRHGHDITFPKDNWIDIEVSERIGQQLSQR
ncbi:MAG TPA: hypothetical protein VHT28_17315 [Silvibacterium sp.]|nr:hypothetical protein [Silvibacterium sp.]